RSRRGARSRSRRPWASPRTPRADGGLAGARARRRSVRRCSLAVPAELVVDDAAGDDGAQGARASLVQVGQQRGAGAGVGGPGVDPLGERADGEVPRLPQDERGGQSGAQGAGMAPPGDPLAAAARGEEGGAVAEALRGGGGAGGGADPGPRIGGLVAARGAEGERGAVADEVEEGGI